MDEDKKQQVLEKMRIALRLLREADTALGYEEVFDQMSFPSMLQYAIDDLDIDIVRLEANDLAED